jgi:molecular chaperone Hsp33
LGWESISNIKSLEKKISGIKGITSLLDADMSPEMILEQILGEFGVEFLDTIPTKYHCSCTKQPPFFEVPVSCFIYY